MITNQSMESHLTIDGCGTRRWNNSQGFYHRIDGPAVEYLNGSKCWYFNGLLHRIEGPAIEYPDGDDEWHYYGQYIDCQSQTEFERLIKLKVFW